MLLAELIQFFDQFAPRELAEEWDNVGLLVGDPATQVNRILTCLTLTPDVAQEAIDSQVDLVVAHHPVLFRPVQRITTDNTEGAMLLELIRANVAVFSPHTRYDNATEGINAQIARRLELQNMQPLKTIATTLELPGGDAFGAGRVGELSNACSLKSLVETIKQKFDVDRLGVIGAFDSEVRRVGIACGSAAMYLEDAKRLDCAVFITGEARFHDCLAARTMGIAMLLLGHYASERFAMEQLAVILHNNFPPLVIQASQTECDPLQWL